MITRKILVEQIRRKLAGGNVPNNFAITELEVGKQVDQVANEVIYIRCADDGAWDNFLTTYENVPITLDSAKALYYFEIPRVIGFKNQQGVFQVSSMKDQESIFMPLSANGQWLYQNINEVLEGCVGYYNDQKRVYLVNYNPATNTDNLLVKLVVDRSELDEEADYQITPEVQKLILRETVNFFQPQSK